MSEQAPVADQEGSQELDAHEVAALQRAINEIALKEQQLAAQREQLRQRIAHYQQQAWLARASDREGMARQARDYSERLQSHLPLLQQQLETLHVQHEQLAQHLAQVEGAPPLAAPDEADAAGAAQGGGPLTPAMPDKVAAPKSRNRKLLAVLCLLAVTVVVAPLLLFHSRNGILTPPKTTKTYPTPTLTPTPPPIVFTPAGTAPATKDCQTSLNYPCYSPEQIQGAFHLNALYKQGYDGQGQTIVIVGTGHTTTLKDDLHAFDLAWGLPDPPSFQILQPRGDPAPYDCGPDGDALTLENTLDVEWSHAIAPGANIVLLIWGNGYIGAPPEQNCGIVGIEDAVAYALDHQLGKIISISYGGSELGFAGETASEKAGDQQLYARADAIFKRAANEHVTVLAATGDTGVTNPDGSSALWKTPNVSWPASDPYVLAVGGTTVQIVDTNGDTSGEQVWNDTKLGGSTGGGLSNVFSEPDYQKLVPNQSLFHGQRGIPDVAFPAGINYSLYSASRTGAMGKINPQKWNHWDLIGGTSASAPCWAGVIALANQLEGSSLGFIQPALYQLRGQGLNDITKGDNSFGGVPGYQAQAGYDLASGWGSPLVDQLIPDLITLVNNAPAPCPQGPRQCS
jgi:subtilase family serine protease